LVIPGSEEYLAKGISDGRSNVFGPDSRGARLESSKCFAKLFMEKHGIKSARFEIATTHEQLYDALKQFNPPYVVKLDGLAQGKGVIITHSFDEALDKGTKLMNGNMFENVKGPVVVDEYLDGWELSAIAIVMVEISYSCHLQRIINVHLQMMKDRTPVEWVHMGLYKSTKN